MIIQENDFRMELVPGTNLFDLELIKVVNAKDETKRREEFENAGYAMSREKCLQKVIHYRLNKKQDVYSLKEYLNACKQERLLLEKLLNEN